MARWFKEVNPDVPLGVCATIDRGTDPFFPGSNIDMIQKTMPMPAKGFTINIESHKRDNYDTDGVYTEQGMKEQLGWFEDYRKMPNAAIFLHACFITGVSGRDGSAPHAERGGYGKTPEDAGVRWYYEWVRDNVGRWEFPKHVPEKPGGPILRPRGHVQVGYRGRRLQRVRAGRVRTDPAASFCTKWTGRHRQVAARRKNDNKEDRCGSS